MFPGVVSDSETRAGSPREWLDRALPFQVSFDSGIRMFHEDAFYMANDSTLIPLFRAVDAMTLETGSEPAASAIDWAAIDFVTDRNNLRKLLRWVREPGPTKTIQVSSPTSEVSPTSPTSDASEGKQGNEAGAEAALEWDPRRDFRIDLQLGGANTVLMERWAARTREVITPPKGGCRANFEREHTAAAEGCENGGGHYRIVQYVSSRGMQDNLPACGLLSAYIDHRGAENGRSLRGRRMHCCEDGGGGRGGEAS